MGQFRKIYKNGGRMKLGEFIKVLPTTQHVMVITNDLYCSKLFDGVVKVLHNEEHLLDANIIIVHMKNNTIVIDSRV